MAKAVLEVCSTARLLIPILYRRYYQACSRPPAQVAKVRAVQKNAFCIARVHPSNGLVPVSKCEIDASDTIRKGLFLSI